MARRRVRLAVWVRYDSSDGYVWPQVYGTEKEARLDEKMNHPVKVMKLTSEPYFVETVRSGNSFGTEVTAAERANAKEE